MPPDFHLNLRSSITAMLAALTFWISAVILCSTVIHLDTPIAMLAGILFWTLTKKVEIWVLIFLSRPVEKPEEDVNDNAD